MKPSTQDHLDRAKEDLDEAAKILAIGLINVAARCAYFAAFHAAEALIYERLGKTVKTHNGVRTEFSRIVAGYGEPARPLTAFLARAYEYKDISDYGIGRATLITGEMAQTAIADGVGFVNLVTHWLAE